MKIPTHFALAAILGCCIGLFTVSCGEDQNNAPVFPTVPTTPSQPEEPLDPDQVYDWEAARTEVPSYTDMVLIYGGGHQRYIYNWDKDRFASYVRYYPRTGASRWFFDSYLFLEFADYGSNSAMVTYATGYRDPSTKKMLDSATKNDWLRVIDYYFDPSHNIAALDATIEEAKAVLGAPAYKRQVVITIPEPIVRQNTDVNYSSTTYWGEIDGRQMDFSKTADRVLACKWFIDQVRARFNKAGYKNVELAGFYWLAEHSSDSQSILLPISEYLHQFHYSFNWIPYYNAAGYAKWKTYGFDYAFLQPNYFFNDATPLSQLESACQMAATANMAMEMEFDDNALSRNGRAYKLINYMDAFRRYKVWDERPLAYYQGNNTVHSLRTSTTGADVDLYHQFGEFVTTRPYRDRK